MNYDYIITGSGCAGLSLLYRILKNPSLNSKKILVIDKDKKTKNDRTWCFWEKEKGLFEKIVCHEWNELEFLSSGFTKSAQLKNYSYKMIQGIDFYSFVLDFCKDFENVSFKYESVEEIKSKDNFAIVKTENASYQSQYVFNSTSLFNPEINTKNSLLQHFEGWVIKTKEPIFNSKKGTLMDFRLSQENGTTFMYVLPTSETEALIEYTLFSEKVLEKKQYKIALENYIKDYLKIEDYEILHTEYGIIPMSLAHFSRNTNEEKRIINIGTAGGFTKASSGYTFQFIQKNTAKIVENLAKGNFEIPKTTFREKMFHWYDRTLIEVMISKKMNGKEIFSTLFKKIPMEKILSFLGNESSFLEEIKIMNSLPKIPFFTSGLKQMK